MSDIPVCQQCGKKLYKSYGSRGILATPDHQYHGKGFRTVEERDKIERLIKDMGEWKNPN